MCGVSSGKSAFGDTKETKEKYLAYIKSLRLTVDEYLQLKRAFQGGFTHASPFYVDKIVENVDIYDFTSSYPAVIVAEKFPVSSSQIVPIRTMNQFESNLRKYCCLFDVEFVDIESTFPFDNYISSSRCTTLEGEVLNNGRVVRASRLITTITEQDYFIIRKTYRWKGNPRIGSFRRYEKGYLPKPFVDAVLDLYVNKTTLKGIPEKIEEYNKSKEMANSCFGMCVTDPVREEITYIDNQWKSETADYDPHKKRISRETIKEAIHKYNCSFSRFLFYPWGVWITAYARRNLWSAILETKSDHVYSDTDSEKLRNYAQHQSYFEKYNQTITRDLLTACEYHKIDPNKIHPKTITGKEKWLGVWDFDGHYSRFKTLGAKRYLVEYEDIPENGSSRGTINITVSGINKHKAVPPMLQKFGEDGIFNAFTHNLYVPAQHTGKLTHTYIDREITTTLTDYEGRECDIYEKSVVHLEPSDYRLSMTEKFMEYVMHIRAEYLE